MIMKTHAYSLATLLFSIGLILSSGGPVGADTVLDNFELYQDGQMIGVSATSMPWRRFGDATNDDFIVTGVEERVISGALSAQYCVYWPNRFGSVRFAFPEPTDLSSYIAVRCSFKSTDIVHAESDGNLPEPITYTEVALVVSDGTTTYEAAVPVPLARDAQTVTFYLTEGIMVLPDHRNHRKVPVMSEDGPTPFSKVISSVDNIGLIFRSRQGNYTETIVIDDLTLMSQRVVTRKLVD